MMKMKKVRNIINKRGQGGISMDTIVIAIVAVIVLLLLVTWATDGFGTIGEKIVSIFILPEEEQKQDNVEAVMQLCTREYQGISFLCIRKDRNSYSDYGAQLINTTQEDVDELFIDCPEGKIQKMWYCEGNTIEISPEKFKK